MLIGYARVSTLDRNLDLRSDSLQAAGAKRLCADKVRGMASRPEPDGAFVAALVEVGSRTHSERTRGGTSVDTPAPTGKAAA